MSDAEFSQGFRFEGGDPEGLQAALDAAFDYRGNVTLLLHQGGEVVGYLSNRNWSAPEPFVELIPEDGTTEDGGSKRRLSLATIRGVAFTGRDTAEGRSWQAWLKKHEAKKEAPS